MRRLLPASFRRWARRTFDRFFCRSGLGLERLGRDSGWWVVSSRLKDGAAVLSGGAGNDISFELDLARNRGCQVAVFDPSPTGVATFERSGGAGASLAYFPVGLDGHDHRVGFAAPQDAREGSYSITRADVAAVLELDCLSPASALGRAGFREVELVKIDIEGFEYAFLDAMLAAGITPHQVAVEFHHFLPHIPIGRTWRAIRRLHAAGYRIVHKEQCDYLFVHRSLLEALTAPSRRPDPVSVSS